MWFFIKEDFENWHGPHSIHWERLWKSPHIHFLCDSSLYRAVTISCPYRSSTNQSAAVSLFYILMYLNHGSCFLRTLTDRMGFRKLSYIAPNGTWGKKETFLVRRRGEDAFLCVPESISCSYVVDGLPDITCTCNTFWCAWDTSWLA